MAKLNEQWVVEPHGPLQAVADGLWSVEGSISMPLGRFPRRMTIIRLVGGGLAIWSPIALDEPNIRRLDELGTVAFLIVPNAGHRLDLKAWKSRYPKARVIGPAGAREAIGEAAPIDATEDDIGDNSLAFEHVAGVKSDELALIMMRDDGTTLILNDILSSVSHPKGIGANIMARLFGFGVRRPRTSRLVRRMYVHDPALVADQFRKWAALPNLRRLIVSHVDIIDVEPAAVLQRAADDLESR